MTAPRIHRATAPSRWSLLALVLAGVTLVAGPVAARQEPAQPPTQEPADETVRPATEDDAVTEDDDDLDFLDEGIEDEAADDEAERGELDFIEDLLEQGEDSLDTGFVYDPGGRRDPFRSLLEVTDSVEPRVGPRPEGIPGLLIDEITVSGIWMFPEGPVAQVESASDPMSYLLRPGTRVFDGEIVSITYDREEGGKVVFRQIVRDRTSPKPFREVVRRVEQ